MAKAPKPDPLPKSFSICPICLTRQHVRVVDTTDGLMWYCDRCKILFGRDADPVSGLSPVPIPLKDAVQAVMDCAEQLHRAYERHE